MIDEDPYYTQQIYSRYLVKEAINESYDITEANKINEYHDFMKNKDIIQKYTINFICNNQQKIDQVKNYLKNTPFKLQVFNLDLIEIQGTSQEIAIDKCYKAVSHVMSNVLIEDTSFICDELSNDQIKIPGPYIKYFLQKKKDDQLFINNLLKTNKKASFISTFSFCKNKHYKPITFTGIVNGEIVEPLYKTNEPTFDDIFKPYEEITPREKAFNKFLEWYKIQN